jgi:metallo-beta-lactamase family protein
MAMRIRFHGAARTVTGSMHLIEINGSNLLLECGMYQGPRRESYERNRNFPFDPRSIDAVILSHAHIDHSGNLPHLVKAGYEGPIYATPATAHLADIMLRDSGHIQEADAAYINKRQRGNGMVEPLYTEADAARVKSHLSPVPYEAEFSPAGGVTARFRDAGHILGSAAIDLQLTEGGRSVRFWFSGDIGQRKLPILRDPILPEHADYLLMECTYGDKPHRDPDLAILEFGDVVRRTVERGGKVIIPAFAVGRTQEIVYALNVLMDSGKLPKIPVFVDSPLAVEASQVFLLFPDCYDPETLAFIREGHHPALSFDMLTYVRSVDESKALNTRADPMIIISASGMAENGRILHHIKNNIGDPRSTICIVGWQAPNTLGRHLADREEWVRIFGDTYHRRADVATIGGLSAHAGQDLLIEYALQLKGEARQVFLVHGEQKPASLLTDRLRAEGLDRVSYPELHSVADL